MRRLVPFSLCALAMMAGAVAVADPVFTNVVDSTDPLILNAGAPSLNDSGQVAFSAQLKTGGFGIVRMTAGGPITMITETPTGPYSLFAGTTSINDFGVVAFEGRLDGGAHQISSGSGGALTNIASTASFFSGIGTRPAISDSGFVAFSGTESASGESGMYASDGTTLRTIATTADFFFFQGNPDINDSDLVAFKGNSPTGIFAGLGGGPPSVVIDPVTVSVDFEASLNNLGQAVVTGVAGGQFAIIYGDGGDGTPLIDASGPISSFNSPNLNDFGAVMFLANLDVGGPAIYFGAVGGGFAPIISVGDPLFGSTVTSLSVARGGLNDQGQFAFRYALADLRNGVAIVTIPEPSSLALFAGAGSVGAGFVWRRRRPFGASKSAT